jgi:hypothetical protein
MNLKEVKQPSDKKLFEEIEATNDTGFLTEDLVKVVRAKDGPWSEPMTSEQLTEHIRKLCGG